MPAVNPRTFPTTGPERLGARFATIEQRVRGLQTRNLPREFVRQTNAGVLDMTVDTGVGTFTIPASGQEADATVTPTLTPLNAFILVTPHGDSEINAVTANVFARTSTDFQVHFVSLTGAPIVSRTLNFDWAVVNLTPA